METTKEQLKEQMHFAMNDPTASAEEIELLASQMADADDEEDTKVYFVLPIAV